MWDVLCGQPGSELQVSMAGGKAFALPPSFHPGTEPGASFVQQYCSLCCRISLSFTHVSITHWLSGFSLILFQHLMLTSEGPSPLEVCCPPGPQ